jgi:hypothetical protein
MQRVRDVLADQPARLLLRSLTRSFRFGAAIASVGNAILRVKQVRAGRTRSKLCCRPGTAVELLRPAVNPALAGGD